MTKSCAADARKKTTELNVEINFKKIFDFDRICFAV
jgi:hypothetical protein